MDHRQGMTEELITPRQDLFERQIIRSSVSPKNGKSVYYTHPILFQAHLHLPYYTERHNVTGRNETLET